MNCDELRKLLQDYATRELSADDRHRVDAHLMECVDCRRELVLMSAVVSGLDSQPVSEPAPGFDARVMAGLPRHRELALSPWWSLTLAPLLGVLVYVFRAPLLGFLFDSASRLGLDPGRVGSVSLPDPGLLTIQHLGLFAGAVVVVTLGLTAGAAALGWQYFTGRD